MFVLYLDEFGHSGAFDQNNPRYSHHPLFGFAGLTIEGSRWRDLDRGFLRLKTGFYSRELKRAYTIRGLRPERWEPKQLTSRRDRRFAAELLRLIDQCGGKLLAYGSVKHSTPQNHSHHGLYNSHVQGSLRQYEKFLRNFAGHAVGRGAVIMDRRTEKLNQLVLESAQSHLFSNPALNRPDARIIETPLLVPSEWYHGVQMADIVGRVIAAVYQWRLLRNSSFQWADQLYGPHLARLAYSIGNWTTLYVRP